MNPEILVALCLIVGPIQAQKAQAERGVPTPVEAVRLAVADIQAMEAESRIFQRYVWVPTGSVEDVQAIAFTLNAVISRASVILPTRTAAGGKLVRVDLRSMAPRANQAAQLALTWEKLIVKEPYFHIHVVEKVKVAPFKAVDGKTYDWRFQSVAKPAPHADDKAQAELMRLTGSQVPIVRNDYFLKRTLTTLGGGLYYEFVGVERNPKGKTAKQAFLESLGVDAAKIEALRADQRAAVFTSRVTGKPRQVEFLQGEGVKPAVGIGLVTITHDSGEDDIEADQDPIRNLLKFRDKAQEVIGTRPNGLHVFALFSAAGELQDSAPDDVVKDHLIPPPNVARLQPGISCIRCHGPDGGYKSVQNDVRALISSYLDVFGDLKDVRRPIPDTLDRLAGLYAGDLTKPLDRGREDYADAIFLATSGGEVRSVLKQVSDTFNAYQFDAITPGKALAELGLVVPDKIAAQRLKELIPPLPIDEVGIVPEDPYVGALKDGFSISRAQFEPVYADMATRLRIQLIAKEQEDAK